MIAGVLSERGPTLMVLIPGATYDHRYWDVGYEPATFNFCRAMNRAGISTLAIDRLGTGASDRPSGWRITHARQVEAITSKINAMRSSFERILLAGHSLGSATASRVQPAAPPSTGSSSQAAATRRARAA